MSEPTRFTEPLVFRQEPPFLGNGRGKDQFLFSESGYFLQMTLPWLLVPRHDIQALASAPRPASLQLGFRLCARGGFSAAALLAGVAQGWELGAGRGCCFSARVRSPKELLIPPDFSRSRDGRP